LKGLKTYGIVIFLLLPFTFCWAQYFGRNKPSYEEFDFSLYKTPHFELYHYFSDEELAHQLGQQAEKWYHYHQQVLLDTFYTRNPIIFYTNHGDFQQTTAISSHIDVGTGGVTEGLKRRVVLPLTFSHRQTDHVLGHELVHAFQYHILTESDELSLSSVNNIPLWMIEGMAEYLSIGQMDSQTNLWMRDALIQHQFPTLHEMTNYYRYSPYRFGHAFWAYIAYKYGEQYIHRLFKATATSGYEQAIGDVLAISTDSLSKAWKATLTEHLLSERVDSTFSIIGNRLISKKNGGHYNLSPVLSPDGKYLIFLSERDVYSLDLFLADATSGKVLKRFYTATRHDEIDAISFLETAGSWSPDSRYFTYVAYIKGQTALLIFDVKKRSITDEVTFPELDGISCPSWSPRGQELVFSGLKNGISDLYTYRLTDAKLMNITKNNYSCLQPSWSVNGDSIFFVSDQPYIGQITTSLPFYNISSIRKSGENLTVYKTFDGARNVNPLPTKDGREVLFLSNRDGRRNLYSASLKDGSLHQLTNYPTGITGMTELSPALTMAGDTICYTMLWDGRFTIFSTTCDRLRADRLPVKDKRVNLANLRITPYSPIPSQVETNLYYNRQPIALGTDSFYRAPIEPKFKLDYIGNLSAGVMAGRFGTGMAGSIEAMFSDMLGNHVLYSGLSINGQVYDFGGQVAYMNQKRRIKLGVSLSHIPFRTGSYGYETDSLPDGTAETSLSYLYRRTFEDKLGIFAYFPINRSKRFEIGAAYAFYNYRTEKMSHLTSYSQVYSGKKEVIDSPPGFGVAILDAAFVIDNAKMGLASPVEGKRLRIQLEHYMHGLNMQTLLIDYRKYFFIKPYSLAFRFYHYGRYGGGSDSERLTSLFMGYPWFIRGYDMGDFYGDETKNPGTISMNQIIGSRMLVTNCEWRIPFSGPEEIAFVPSSLFFTEMALFFDAGVSWTSQSQPRFSLTTNTLANRIPVFATGLAYRINLFGAMVIEPYYAFPIHQRRIKKGSFGINVFAGW
jgi:Tol biopolymer transport system component